jgi:peptide/nickel transport system substrate-binding protein
VVGTRKSSRSGKARRLEVAAITVAVLLAIAAAPVAGAQEQPAQKVTFTVGITTDVDSLNPFIGIVAEAYEVYQVMYDYLVGYSPKDFSPVPELAESWQVSQDGLTWTFKIRQGAKWSDGQPVTARDAAYTFNRIMKGTFEKTNYPYTDNIKTVTATDDAAAPPASTSATANPPIGPRHERRTGPPPALARRPGGARDARRRRGAGDHHPAGRPRAADP